MGDTPLHLAAEKSDTKTTAELLAAGADLYPFAHYTGGYTPIRTIGEAIIALANAGADPYGKGASRRAYLHWAAAVGHIEAIAALLAAGADPDAKDF